MSAVENRSARTTSPITVSPIAGALGAEISGIDLPEDLSDDVVAAIRDAWLRHLVVFFRGQSISDDEFVRFAGRIGPIGRYPFVPGIADHPEIIAVLKTEDEVVNFGGIWHSDTTYLDRPPSATLLLAREIPPQGGDTMFANQYLAYETLSPAMQALLRPLRAVNTSGLADVSSTREDRVKGSYLPAEDLVATHPVVRTHPETGREALYVNIAHTERFDGMTVEESRGLLQFLFAHQSRPEHTCRLRWAPGTLAMWDNRCVHHYPINDYQGHRRLLHRITIEGDVPI